MLTPDQRAAFALSRLARQDDEQGKAIRWLMGQAKASREQQTQLFQWQQRSRMRRPSLLSF